MPIMERINSSNIFAAGYDEQNSVMRVQFNSNVIYDYQDVPEKLYLEFSNSHSKGTFFAKNIRTKFAYKKIDG